MLTNLIMCFYSLKKENVPCAQHRFFRVSTTFFVSSDLNEDTPISLLEFYTCTCMEPQTFNSFELTIHV